MCKKKMSDMFMRWEDKLIISGEHAFHLETTHGIPHELLPDLIYSHIWKTKSLSQK